MYLHYVLDLWFEKVVKPRCDGEANRDQPSESDGMNVTPCIADASTTEEPGAEKLARRGLCGGPLVRAVPTAETFRIFLLRKSYLVTTI